MSTLQYKGYTAKIEFDSEDHIFTGHVIGITDVIGFHGQCVQELEKAFYEAVDNYLAACEQLGQAPNKSYSGKLMLRISPELHAAVAKEAEIKGHSINQWATEVLKSASHS